MQVFYTRFDKVIGYNYKNENNPFYLIHPIYVIVRYANKKLYLKLDESDFISDGCSIPKGFRWLFGCPHTGKYLPASIIHDWILEHPENVHYHRALANQIFKTVLLNEGVSPLKAQFMYLAVDIWQAVKNVFVRKWR